MAGKERGRSSQWGLGFRSSAAGRGAGNDGDGVWRVPRDHRVYNGMQREEVKTMARSTGSRGSGARAIARQSLCCEQGARSWSS
jgi:hypothetical protein